MQTAAARCSRCPMLTASPTPMHTARQQQQRWGLRRSSSATSSSLRRRSGPRPVCFREEPNQPQQQQHASPTSPPDSVEHRVEHKVTQTTAKVVHTMSGFLSRPESQARAYWVQGSVALLSAAACLAAPRAVVQRLLAVSTGSDPVVDTLVRLAGATLLATTCCLLTLKEAALRQQLHLDTFRRLNCGLVLQSAAILVLTAQAVSLRSPALIGYAALVWAPCLGTASRVYALTKPAGSRLPLPSPKRVLSAALGLLLPRNAQAAGYSALTVGCAAAAAACWGVAPGDGLRLYEGVHGPLTVFAQRATAAGLLLLTLVGASLKDAADRRKLAATTFRWLNFGAAASLLAALWYLTADWLAGLMLHSARSAGVLWALAAACAFTAWMYAMGATAAASQPRPASSQDGA